MKRRTILFATFDFLLLFLAFIGFSYLFSAFPPLFSSLFWLSFAIISFSWMLWSFLFKKYSYSISDNKEKIIFDQIKVDALFFLLAFIYLIFFPALFPRYLFALLILFISLSEGILTYLYLLDKSLNKDMEDLDIFSDYLKVRDGHIYPVYDVEIKEGKLYKALKELITEECGEEAFLYIKKHIPLTDKDTMLVSTTTRFNIKNQPKSNYKYIVNLKNINDAQYVNKFFEEINAKLVLGGIYLGSVETYALRKKRILKKFPPVLNWVYYTFDYMVKRVAPKLLLTKKIYFYITGGRNRVMSRAEVLGRLYSCGFEVFDEGFIGDKLFYIALKIDEPKFDLNPTYGPFIKLKRYGKDNKIIGVYKLRTMHAFSEYIQEYVYSMNGSITGDKFSNDFRVTTIGHYMRKFWIDELPMLINLFKGELKIVGVRPLSFHKLSIYPEELKSLRSKYKPGLIPPYYADLPKNQEEMWQSEKNYLLLFSKKPFTTDIKYFLKAIYNILIKKARSK